MCGIVGYVGNKEAQDVILYGLGKLEYRGYDSAGVALVTENGLKIEKEKGRLRVLEEKLKASPISSTVGIGHTRWATHGAPTKVNAHPHSNAKNTIAVIHNGIIENYQKLKEELIQKGYVFKSDTDTEVIAHYIDSIYKGDILDAVMKAVKVFTGAYAIGVVSSDNPDEIVAVRKESPLIVGLGEGENFIASDIPAILKYTNKVYFIDNGEIVHLTRDYVKVYDESGSLVEKKAHIIDLDIESASKGGYEHYTLKEIHEQAEGISNTLNRRIDENGFIKLDEVKLTKEDIESFTKIYIVACGTSYHAGLVGRALIEKWAKISVETDIASEFRYREPFMDKNTLVIFISQSGETADTLAAIKEAKAKGARILAVTNVVGSSIVREANDVLYTWAGPEIGVCSTKAYTTQLMAMYMISLHLAFTKGVMREEEYKDKIEKLKMAGNLAKEVLSEKEEYKEIAKRIQGEKSAFYIGRGLDYLTSLEGALKLKEISYIHTEAFPAGELKHGTISLIEAGTPVFALATQSNLLEKTLSNMQEVKARGGYTIAIIQEKDISMVENTANTIITIPNVEDWMAPIISVIPTQLIAYYTSLIKGNDVDKPRNLAKSVTVE